MRTSGPAPQPICTRHGVRVSWDYGQCRSELAIRAHCAEGRARGSAVPRRNLRLHAQDLLRVWQAKPATGSGFGGFGVTTTPNPFTTSQARRPAAQHSSQDAALLGKCAGHSGFGGERQRGALQAPIGAWGKKSSCHQSLSALSTGASARDMHRLPPGQDAGVCAWCGAQPGRRTCGVPCCACGAPGCPCCSAAAAACAQPQEAFPYLTVCSAAHMQPMLA